MPTDVVVVLERLRCIREEDELGASHSEPYIWPVLLSIESTQFGVTAPTK
jgi:hypothetical protein